MLIGRKRSHQCLKKKTPDLLDLIVANCNSKNADEPDHQCSLKTSELTLTQSVKKGSLGLTKTSIFFKEKISYNMFESQKRPDRAAPPRSIDVSIYICPLVKCLSSLRLY